jgi:CNT family concentrative nucleoside transporter
MIWQSIVGLFGLISIAWGMSENRRKVSWKGILVGLLIQFILVSLLLKVSAFRHVFEFLNRAVMAPVVWLIGIPWSEAQVAGSLMGTKTILNEFIAYMDLAQLPEGVLSPKSKLIMIYALCGFANLGSLGILIGGMGSMVPERRGEIVSLGMRSIISGTLATCMAGAIVGIIT